MPYSRNRMFKVSVLDSWSQKSFTELITPDFKCYICVQQGQPFKISLQAENTYAENTYGCNLYLDGQLVKMKKTFKKKGMYHGFKLGGGKFKEFIFNSLVDSNCQYEEEKAINKSYDNYESNNNRYKYKKNDFKRIEHLGQDFISTVHVKFYKTKERDMSKVNKQNQKFIVKKFQKQPAKLQDVKNACHSLSVQEGGEFEISVKNHKRRKIQEDDGWGPEITDNLNNNDKVANEQSDMFKDYTILEKDGEIDHVTIHYANIASLQMLGILSLNNYNHLCMIPPSLLSEASYIINVFRVILEKKQSIHISECSAEFEAATFTKLEELFVKAEDELPQFFKLKRDIFCISKDGTVTLNHFNSLHKPSNKSKKKKKTNKQHDKEEIIVID